MILIIGATGRTGGHVLASLVAAGAAVRAVSRRPASAAGVDWRTGDARDPALLARALDGVDRVFLALSNGPEQATTELGVVAAAARAGVRHLVKLSAPIVDEVPPVAIARTHRAVERAIEATGMGYTHLRPYAFMQNLLSYAPTIAQLGAIFGSTGDAPLNWVDVRDVGDVGAAVLLAPAPPVGPLVLTGDRTWSMPAVAALLTERLGTRVAFVQQDEAALRRGLARAAREPWLIEHLVEIQRMAVAYREEATDTVARVLGRAPRSLPRFLAEHLDRFHGRRTLGHRMLAWWLHRGAA